LSLPNSSVERIHLLNKMTEELRVIQTLQNVNGMAFPRMQLVNAKTETYAT
jgi:hypothetical protein